MSFFKGIRHGSKADKYEYSILCNQYHECASDVTDPGGSRLRNSEAPYYCCP